MIFGCNCRRQSVILVPGVHCVFQNKAIQVAMHFRALEIETTQKSCLKLFFHSNCGDGGGLRIVLGINLRYIINTLLRKTLLNLLDQSVTYRGEIMGIS